MSRTLHLSNRGCAALLRGLAILPVLAALPGCQSPQGAAEAKKRMQAGQAEEAGFQRWRANYRQAAERHAKTPAWTPPQAQPETQPSVRKTSYSSVHVSGRVLAMTFDDGPHPSNTPRLLDLLKQRKLRATFFVTGQNAKEYPAILRRMVAEGHEVANHTWSHADLTRVSMASARKELADTREAIVAATGVEPKLFRPPYGAVNSSIRSLCSSEFGYSTILWSVDPLDWKRPGVSVVTSRLVNGAHAGGILLAHDIHGPTIEAMPATFDRLLAQGYKFVTVSQLIDMEVAREPAQSKSGSRTTSGELVAKTGM